MSFPVCPVCTYPVRRRGRTVHKSCEPQRIALDAGNETTVAEVVSIMLDRPGRECAFCYSTNTSEKDGGWFCEKHYPYDERATVQNRTLTTTPERCERCGELVTPKVTLGNIKCKCDQPKMPLHLRGNDKDDSPPSQVRYGN